MLQTSGADQQQQQQNQINAQMSKFNNAWNYPTQQLNTLLSALGMSPHDTATSGSGTSQSTTESTPNWAELGANLFGTASKLDTDRWLRTRKMKKVVTLAPGADPTLRSPDPERPLQGPALVHAENRRPDGAGRRGGNARLDRQAERRHGCST